MAGSSRSNSWMCLLIKLIIRGQQQKKKLLFLLYHVDKSIRLPGSMSTSILLDLSTTSRIFHDLKSPLDLILHAKRTFYPDGFI